MTPETKTFFKILDTFHNLFPKSLISVGKEMSKTSNKLVSVEYYLVVDGETIVRAGVMGLDPQEYLDRNDSYNFFKQTESLLITGPTGTNVMDVQIVVIQ